MRRRLVTTALLLTLSLISTGISAQSLPEAKQNGLHRVQKIYIGELGASDEAARFRLLLEDKLSAEGFTIVDKSEKADALLSGAISVSPMTVYSDIYGNVAGGEAQVAVTVRLISQSGERLWDINLPKPRRVSFNPYSGIKSGLKGVLKTQVYKEPVEFRAEELAKELRGDWKESARAAGIKVGK
jgi:hypothetical protein